MEDRVTSVADRLAPAKGSGVSMGVVIVVLLAVDLVVVTAIVGAMAPHALWLVLLICVGSPIAAFWLVHLFGWRPWQRRYPAQPQSRTAVVRINQSFQLGQIARLNNCLHIAADEDHLHLIPFCALRWVGSDVVSIPWSAIQDAQKTRFGDYMRARVDGRRIMGPSWCMSLAAPPETDNDEESS